MPADAGQVGDASAVDGEADTEQMQPYQDRPPTSDFELRDLLAIIRRQIVPIVVVTVVVFAAFALMSYRKDPVYQATTSILVDFDALRVGSRGSSSEANRNLQNEIELLQGAEIRRAAAEAAGRPISVSADTSDGSDVIVLSSSGGDPEEVAEVVNTYAAAYIDVRQNRVESELQLRIDELNSAIEAIQDELDELNASLNGLYDQRANLPPNAAEEARLAQQITATEATRNTRQGARDSLRQEASELSLAMDQARDAGGLQLLGEASPPSSPSSPDHRQDLLIGLAAALVVAAGVAFLREQLDDSIRTKEELERQSGLPVLGIVPRVATWRDVEDTHLETRARPRSAASESYRTLLTSLDFIQLETPLKVLQVTSASPGEGKTTTAANLAVAYADAGRRTLIVCCDLRRPRLHRFFDLPPDPGFTSVLLGQLELEDAVQPVPGTPGLHLLAAGPMPANPAELLRGARARRLLQQLREGFDLVIVDSPPVLPVADALVLAHEADGTLIVGTAHQTTRRRLRRAVESLRQIEAPLVGAVLNAVPATEDYGYDIAYYGYEDERGSQRDRTSGRNGSDDGHPGEPSDDVSGAPADREGAQDGESRPTPTSPTAPPSASSPSGAELASE